MKQTPTKLLGAERIAKDPSVKGYNDLDELFAALKKMKKTKYTVKYTKDHTADSVACCVVFLLAPLEDVTQKLLFSIIPK